jgi:succinate dehydrogenase/fumarate reductase flavoprotein subunit
MAGVRRHRVGRHPGGGRSQGRPAARPADRDGRTFNSFTRSGVDEDFHRGESAYDRYYGDPTNKPNPNLGEITHPPYYAAKVVPGDLDTKGGIRADVHACALRDDGSVIAGLCAGNASAPVMGHLSRSRRDHRSGDDVRVPGRAAYWGKELEHADKS